MEAVLKPMPAEELDQDSQALEVQCKEPGERHLPGATSRPNTIGVSWRGLDEEFPSAADAMDRQDQLEARGIEAGSVRGRGRPPAADRLTVLPGSGKDKHERLSFGKEPRLRTSAIQATSCGS